MLNFFKWGKAKADDGSSTQAYITTVSFPRTLANVQEMGEKNAERGVWRSDLETLTVRNAELDWTAPRWAMVGDIVLFYCTLTSTKLVEDLARKAAAAKNSDPRLVDMLERARTVYTKNRGSIFACARVVGPASRLGKIDGHFDSTIFAAIGDIECFKRPLQATRFTAHVKIGQSTITPLHGPQFEGVRAQLAAENKLPAYLAKARLGDANLRAIKPDTWDRGEILAAMRFIDEAQVRSYWLDHLLKALKDPGSDLLEECRCYRNGASTGFADYCVKIDGRWVPVEAKLNMATERDMLGQVGQYVGVERFTPTRGPRRGEEIHEPTGDLCLVVDPSGVYPARSSDFVECRPGQPRWRREELTRAQAPEVRAWLNRQS